MYEWSNNKKKKKNKKIKKKKKKKKIHLLSFCYYAYNILQNIYANFLWYIVSQHVLTIQFYFTYSVILQFYRGPLPLTFLITCLSGHWLSLLAAFHTINFTLFFASLLALVTNSDSCVSTWSSDGHLPDHNQHLGVMNSDRCIY